MLYGVARPLFHQEDAEVDFTARRFEKMALQDRPSVLELQSQMTALRTQLSELTRHIPTAAEPTAGPSALASQPAPDPAITAQLTKLAELCNQQACLSATGITQLIENLGKTQDVLRHHVQHQSAEPLVAPPPQPSFTRDPLNRACGPPFTRL